MSLIRLFTLLFIIVFAPVSVFATDKMLEEKTVYLQDGALPKTLILYDGQSIEVVPRKCQQKSKNLFWEIKTCTSAIVLTASSQEERLMRSGGVTTSEESFRLVVAFIISGMFFVIISLGLRLSFPISVVPGITAVVAVGFTALSYALNVGNLSVVGMTSLALLINCSIFYNLGGFLSTKKKDITMLFIFVLAYEVLMAFALYLIV
jgi:hypothetical protein